MKRTSLFLILTLAFTAASAQLQKGSWLAGGTITGSFEKYKPYNYTDKSLSIAPQAGYFIFDNVAVGTGVNLNVFRRKYDNEHYGSHTLAIAPFARWYVVKGLYVAGQYYYGRGQAAVEDEGIFEFDIATWGGSVGAGYAIFLNEYVAVEPFIGYKKDIQSAKDFSYKTINSTWFVQVGFQVYLHR